MFCPWRAQIIVPVKDMKRSNRRQLIENVAVTDVTHVNHPFTPLQCRNSFSVLHGIAATLPLMQRQRSGQIINIASIGAYAVSPTAAVYCATKYAVRAISEGLRQEVGGDIRVTVIAPGVTESELAESISDEGGRAEMEAFRKIAIPADAIARAIAYAVGQPSDVDVSELIVRPTASPF
jgi:NADP-dependent 3-hydroxy acid dehydrogenase YdfG